MVNTRLAKLKYHAEENLHVPPHAQGEKVHSAAERASRTSRTLITGTGAMIGKFPTGKVLFNLVLSTVCPQVTDVKLTKRPDGALTSSVLVMVGFGQAEGEMPAITVRPNGQTRLVQYIGHRKVKILTDGGKHSECENFEESHRI